MSKMSKMSCCGMGMGKGPGMNILMIAVYIVIAYVIVGYRKTAMPNIPPSSSSGRSPSGCSTGTCGAK
jgi:hypothetical protein